MYGKLWEYIYIYQRKIIVVLISQNGKQKLLVVRVAWGINVSTTNEIIQRETLEYILAWHDTRTRVLPYQTLISSSSSSRFLSLLSTICLPVEKLCLHGSLLSVQHLVFLLWASVSNLYFYFLSLLRPFPTVVDNYQPDWW